VVDLEDRDESPQQAVEVLALADASLGVADCGIVGDFLAELASEQIHAENTARTRTCTSSIYPVSPPKKNTSTFSFFNNAVKN